MTDETVTFFLSPCIGCYRQVSLSVNQVIRHFLLAYRCPSLLGNVVLHSDTYNLAFLD